MKPKMECKNTTFLHSIKVFNSLNFNTNYTFFLSVFKNECNNDCNIDNSTLNKIAHQILSTSKPVINSSANKISNAFIININKPSVIIVIGKVKITNNGFTNKFKIDNTTATITAEM